MYLNTLILQVTHTHTWYIIIFLLNSAGQPSPTNNRSDRSMHGWQRRHAPPLYNSTKSPPPIKIKKGNRKLFFLQVRPHQTLTSLCRHPLGDPLHRPSEAYHLQPARLLCPTSNLLRYTWELAETHLPPPRILFLAVLDCLLVLCLFSCDLTGKEGDIVGFVRVEGERVEGVLEVGGERSREGVDERRKGRREGYRRVGE